MKPKQPPGEVRIIGGLWRRSKLPVPDLPGLRPSGDRLRETLFNWLGPSLTGWRVLDAFAGSGALGFEAASRGAAQVQLLERDRLACQALQASIARLSGAADCMRLQCTDALAWMRASRESFDLILLDPPFDAHAYDAALQTAVPLLAEGGLLYLEAPRAFEPPPGCVGKKHLKAGAVHAHLFGRVGLAPGESTP